MLSGSKTISSSTVRQHKKLQVRAKQAAARVLPFAEMFNFKLRILLSFLHLGRMSNVLWPLGPYATEPHRILKPSHAGNAPVRWAENTLLSIRMNAVITLNGPLMATCMLKVKAG